MVSIDSTEVSQQPGSAADTHKFLAAAWRWHFFAGLYVVPFFITLAVTGLTMLWISVLDGRDGEWITVEPKGAPLAISAQAEAAVAAVPEGTFAKYVAPRSESLAAIFRVDTESGANMVAINPYSAEVLEILPRRAGWYDFVSDIHGSLLLGTTGDRMIEIAASLGMVLLATGIYMWWPRGSRLSAALVPDLTAKGRQLWKSLHITVGVWISFVLVLFLLSGLSWAGVWGGKFVQPWSTFPAERSQAPLSDVTYASLNSGATKEVPWALEQALMPASGSDAGAIGIAAGTPVTLDSVSDFAGTIGFENRFQLNAPEGETGVWTISQDSMSNDTSNATSDRTVHIDQYTGRILTDVRFADYSVYGKGMAVGIAFHEGDLGFWNITLNTVFCLSVIFVSVSGMVMWWKRRPSKAGRLVAPPLPRDMPLWRGAVLVGLAVSLAFPMAGVTILAMIALDYTVLSRIPALARLVS